MGEALLASVTGHGICFLDADGCITRWTEGARVINGYEEREIVGQHLSRLYTAEDVAAGRPALLLATAIEHGRAQDEGWRVRKSGVRFWAEVTLTALADDRGKVDGFVLVTRDLGEERKTEEALWRSEEKLRLMIASVCDYAIFLLDPEGRIMTWNTGAERIKGYRAEEIIGSHFSKFYPDGDVAAGKPARELEVATAKGRVTDEGWRVRKGGSQFWAYVVITAIRDQAGRLVGFGKVTRDLTERRRAEEERARQRLKMVRAEEAVRERDDFITVAAHELRTPLTALQLKLHGLLRKLDGSDPAFANRLDDAIRQSGRLAELIERLLDVSRMSRGALGLQLVNLDLEVLARRVVEDFAEQAAQAGTEVRIDSQGDVHGVWDQRRLEQVVANLFSNALKYGAGKPIDVTVEDLGESVRLTVADRGIGVSRADARRIFDRFERVAPIRNYGGLGLGLYVTRHIVEAHGGRINVVSASGEGATFVVDLPRSAEAATQAQV